MSTVGHPSYGLAVLSPAKVHTPLCSCRICIVVVLMLIPAAMVRGPFSTKLPFAWNAANLVMGCSWIVQPTGVHLRTVSKISATFDTEMRSQTR